MNSKVRWIMALKIWIVIYPSITAFYLLFGEHLAAVPIYLRTFVLTAVLVPWIMFAGVPVLDIFLKRISKYTGTRQR